MNAIIFYVTFDRVILCLSDLSTREVTFFSRLYRILWIFSWLIEFSCILMANIQGKNSFIIIDFLVNHTCVGLIHCFSSVIAVNIYQTCSLAITTKFQKTRLSKFRNIYSRLSSRPFSISVLSVKNHLSFEIFFTNSLFIADFFREPHFSFQIHYMEVKTECSQTISSIKK